MKVSFDFDHTLDNLEVQEYARKLVDRGIEVWITTARFDDKETDWAKDWNDDLHEIADISGIYPERIIFTGIGDKHEFFKDKNFIWHLDDDTMECINISRFTHTFGISYIKNSYWKEKCNLLINHALITM